MLVDFYSNDPTKQGRLLGEGHRSKLPYRSTVPALLFSLGLAIPTLLSSTGRSIYWKVWLAGAVGGALWMKIVT